MQILTLQWRRGREVRGGMAPLSLRPDYAIYTSGNFTSRQCDAYLNEKRYG